MSSLREQEQQRFHGASSSSDEYDDDAGEYDDHANLSDWEDDDRGSGSEYESD